MLSVLYRYFIHFIIQFLLLFFYCWIWCIFCRYCYIRYKYRSIGIPLHCFSLFLFEPDFYYQFYEPNNNKSKLLYVGNTLVIPTSIIKQNLSYKVALFCVDELLHWRFFVTHWLCKSHFLVNKSLFTYTYITLSADSKKRVYNRCN